MLSYRFWCSKNTDSKNLRLVKTKNRRTMLSLYCSVCGSKKAIFIKEQEAKWLLTMVRKTPLLGILWWYNDT